MASSTTRPVVLMVWCCCCASAGQGCAARKARAHPPLILSNYRNGAYTSQNAIHEAMEVERDLPLAIAVHDTGAKLAAALSATEFTGENGHRPVQGGAIEMYANPQFMEWLPQVQMDMRDRGIRAIRVGEAGGTPLKRLQRSASGLREDARVMVPRLPRMAAISCAGFARKGCR